MNPFNGHPNVDPFLHVDMAAPLIFNGRGIYHAQRWAMPREFPRLPSHFFFRPLPASRLPRPGDLATEEENDRLEGMCYLITDEEPSDVYFGDYGHMIPRRTERTIMMVHTISRYNTRDAILWRMIKLKMGIGPNHMWNSIWPCVEQWLIAPRRLIVPPEAAVHLVSDGIAETWSYYGAGEYYINAPVVFATEKHYHSIGGFTGWNGLCLHCVNNIGRVGDTCERLEEPARPLQEEEEEEYEAEEDYMLRSLKRSRDDDEEQEQEEKK